MTLILNFEKFEMSDLYVKFLLEFRQNYWAESLVAMREDSNYMCFEPM